MPLKELALLLFACVIWAFNFIAAASALQHFPPFLLTVLRFALVLLVLWPFLSLPPADQWRRLAAITLSIGAVHFSLMFWAMQRSADITSVAILLQVWVPLATLMAIFGLGERIGWRTAAAIAVAFTGVLVVGLDPLVLGQLDSLALALLASVFMALGSVLMRGLQGVSVFGFQAWCAVFSLPVLIPIALLTEPNLANVIKTAGLREWGGVAYLGLVSSIVAHAIYFRSLQRYPVTMVAPYLLITPVLAGVFGVLIWGDRPGPRLLVGGGMVLSGVLLVVLRARRKSETSVPASKSGVGRAQG